MVSAIDSAPGRLFPRLRATRRRDGQNGGGLARNDRRRRQFKPRFQEILDLEHEADGIAREVLLGLRTTFITPFDRADIQSLITSMDDSVDQ